MIKVFHHRDPDGYASAWVVGKALKGKKIKYIDINYGEDVIGRVNDGDQVYIVDFSVPVDEMDLILKVASKVVWIDHHKSAIEKYDGYTKEIDGIRKDGTAACQLTWDFFFPDNGTPLFIKYVADYDVWTHAYKESTYLHTWFYSDLLPSPDSLVWDDLDEDRDFLNDALEQGCTTGLIDARRSKVMVEKSAYEAYWGDHKILVLNTTQRSSLVFGDTIKEYDFVSVYSHKNNGFTCSLYSVNMDVDGFAKKMGGGGHARACGFACKELPWTSVN